MSDHAPRIAFLRARLDEDEQVARVATAGSWRWENEEFEDEPCPHISEWCHHGPDLQSSALDGWGDPLVVIRSYGYDTNGIYIKRPDAEHIAHWDPKRVLSEVEVKAANP